MAQNSSSESGRPVAIIIGSILAIFTLSVVAYPFLKSRWRITPNSPTVGRGTLAPELESVYDAICTLQLEYQLGHVPQELYQEQLRGYRLRAAAALKRIETDRADDPEWILEQEVLAARAALRGAYLCKTCGTATEVVGDVCPNCGTELPYIEPEPDTDQSR